MATGHASRWHQPVEQREPAQILIRIRYAQNVGWSRHSVADREAKRAKQIRDRCTQVINKLFLSVGKGRESNRRPLVDDRQSNLHAIKPTRLYIVICRHVKTMDKHQIRMQRLRSVFTSVQSSPVFTSLRQQAKPVSRYRLQAKGD